MCSLKADCWTEGEEWGEYVLNGWGKCGQWDGWMGGGWADGWLVGATRAELEG
jgi:hypothetical protein